MPSKNDISSRSRSDMTKTDRDGLADCTVADVALFKTIGLYQILYPYETGRRYRKIIMTIMCTSLAIQLVRVYLSFVHVDMAMYYIVSGINVVIVTYKGHLIVKHRDKLRVMLNAARFTFTSCGLGHPDALIRHRRTASTILRVFAVACYSLVVFYVTRPNMVKTMYGHSGVYFEGFWTMTFFLDTFLLTTNIFFWVIFNCYMVTMCFALGAQFQTVAAGYASLGHRTSSPPSSSIYLADIDLKSDEKKLIYDDLIRLIQDNQQIIQTFNEFLNIMRSVIVVQIIMSSISLIGFLFISLSMYFDGCSIISAPVMTFFSAFTTITLELLIQCYAIGHLEDSKSAVNFGLYSSNWTAMDLKFKKMLLLTMRLNSANRNKIKITPKNIVNLEMFARVMNTNYTILSVLVKANKNK